MVTQWMLGIMSCTQYKGQASVLYLQSQLAAFSVNVLVVWPDSLYEGQLRSFFFFPGQCFTFLFFPLVVHWCPDEPVVQSCQLQRLQCQNDGFYMVEEIVCILRHAGVGSFTEMLKSTPFTMSNRICEVWYMARVSFIKCFPAKIH